MTLGNRIRSRRKELGITQTKLAEAIGCSDKSSISLIENGKADVSTEQLLALTEYLDVPVTWLLGIEPEKVFLHELDPLVTAYKHADKETQLVVRRILGVKKEELSS